MKSGARFTGLDDAIAMMERLARKDADEVAQGTVLDVARDVVEDAKANMPAPTGRMRSATEATPEKKVGRRHSAAVRVGKRAFYWRFVEDGLGPDGVAQQFFLRAREKLTTGGAFRRLFIERLRGRLGV